MYKTVKVPPGGSKDPRTREVFISQNRLDLNKMLDSIKEKYFEVGQITNKDNHINQISRGLYRDNTHEPLSNSMRRLEFQFYENYSNLMSAIKEYFINDRQIDSELEDLHNKVNKVDLEALEKERETLTNLSLVLHCLPPGTF